MSDQKNQYRAKREVLPPPPADIAIGDFWVNRFDPKDCAFVINIFWGYDDDHRMGWVAEFRWLNGQRNKFLTKYFTGELAGQTYGFTYVRKAWLDE